MDVREEDLWDLLEMIMECRGHSVAATDVVCRSVDETGKQHLEDQRQR